jgi:hypothetical protein
MLQGQKVRLYSNLPSQWLHWRKIMFAFDCRNPPRSALSA